MLMSNKETVRDALLAAGGFAAVARKVGANRRETVRWWAINNRVPARWIPRVAGAVGKPEEWFWRLHHDEDQSA